MSPGGEPRTHAEWLAEYARRAEMERLRAVMDPGDEEGLKNAYTDLVEQFHLRRALGKRRRGIVLDMGCGVGRLTALLADRATAVVALDASLPLLEAARRHGVPTSARLVCGDVRRLPLRDGRVAVVATSNVMIHLVNDDDFAACAAEIRRVLAPGGHAIFIEHTSPETTSLREGIVFRSTADVAKVFRAAGLHPVCDYAVRKMPSFLVHLVRTRRLPRLFWPLAARLEPYHATSGSMPAYRDHLFVFRRPDSPYGARVVG